MGNVPNQTHALQNEQWQPGEQAPAHRTTYEQYIALGKLFERYSTNHGELALKVWWNNATGLPLGFIHGVIINPEEQKNLGSSVIVLGFGIAPDGTVST